MKAIASLSKYLGCYDKWLELKHRHNLKWTNWNPVISFENITNPQSSLSIMIKWLKSTFERLPKSDSHILLYCTLTGLRPAEACKSIELVHTNLDTYLNKDKMMLEHYKFPNYFIRRTKQAFVSLITDSIIDIAKNANCRSYNSMRMLLRKHDFEMHMSYCRKIFATYLRINAIQPEIIDLLQGRISKNIFIKHYFRPDFNSNKIRKVLYQLQQKIT